MQAGLGVATVTITRKGQTTIPKELREKYRLVEGSVVEASDAGDGIFLRKVIKTLDLVASGSKRFTYDDMKRRLREMRREDV